MKNNRFKKHYEKMKSEGSAVVMFRLTPEQTVAIERITTEDARYRSRASVVRHAIEQFLASQ
jgi:Arc/MetJ-type ribon-helix-helix transcriptional regulator